MIDVEFDDRKYTGAHYGHLCRAQVRLNGGTINGKPAAFLKSSGIAHATKSKIELGVAGKDGFFDDIKVWNAE